jgi:hypothetical protein
LTNTSWTIEQDVLDVAAGIKAVNADTSVGMYWRSDFALELNDCSGYKAEWKAHPEYRLKMDNGTYVSTSPGVYYIDYTNPDAAAFFAKVLVNVTKAVLPTGLPVLDFVYIDGDPLRGQPYPGINAKRSAQLVAEYYKCFGDIQRQLDAAGHNQGVILNGECQF